MQMFDLLPEDLEVYKAFRPISTAGVVPGDTIAISPSMGRWMIRCLQDGRRLVREIDAGVEVPHDHLLPIIVPDARRGEYGSLPMLMGQVVG